MKMKKRQDKEKRRLPCQAGEFKEKGEDEEESQQGKGKEEITLPGRRRKLVTATGYSPTSDRGESNLSISVEYRI